MASPPLSRAETAFTGQFQAAIDQVASDLAELYQQMNAISYAALNSSQDAIVGRLKTIVNFTQDVESILGFLSRQTLDLIRNYLPAPVTECENESIPVLFTVAERGRFDGTLTSVGYQTSAGYSLIDPQQAMRGVAKPLGRFMAFRSTQSSATATTSNVTVSNTANGWTIVYTPIYVSSENGFGGPSTPVLGYLSPGRYRFGIKQTSPAQWDTSTSWAIPAQNSAYVPLP
jgi:hypothetical protein